ncbi:MAG: hypothetical protein VW397_03285, partial [Candidatus Margulisiibacteriota bacterium]
IYDNPYDNLEFNGHPILSRLFADLPNEKKVHLTIFNKFIQIKEPSENFETVFNRAQNVQNEESEKELIQQKGLGITKEAIDELMSAFNEGTSRKKEFMSINNYIFSKKPDKQRKSEEYYFELDKIKQFSYIMYKLEQYFKDKSEKKQDLLPNIGTLDLRQQYENIVNKKSILQKGSKFEKTSVDTFNRQMEVYEKALKLDSNQIPESTPFSEVIKNLYVLTKNKDKYSEYYQKIKEDLQVDSSGFKLTLTQVPDIPQSFNLESLEASRTIQDVKLQLKNQFEFIETKFRDQFNPYFGEIKFTDIMDVFQKNPSAKHPKINLTYGEMSQRILLRFDEPSQMTFLSEFLYPAIATRIQLDALVTFDNEQPLSEVLKAMKFIRHPANTAQIKMLDSAPLQKLLYLSSNGFDINLSRDKPASKRSPSLLNASQVDALLSIKKSIDKNKTTFIKLDAGEGKTFLSTIASHLAETKSSPIIHIAPFAQDVPDWAPLPLTNQKIDFSKLENGKHYWVKQNDMMQALTPDADIQSLKNAMIFCDEYDRYEDLNQKLDKLGCRKRCNMSATDNIEEVNQKILELGPKFDFLALRSIPDDDIQNRERLFTLANLFQHPDTFNNNLYETTINTILETYNDPKSFINKKLTRLKEKGPVLISRRQNKMNQEFESRTMNFEQEQTSPAFESMMAKAKNYIGKKVQLIFQGIEFTATDSNETSIPLVDIKRYCQSLFQQDNPVCVHLCAPKGMENYKEGHPITLVYNGKKWEINDFEVFQKEPIQGTHVTLYDTHTKVGGDFMQFSNKVDYQAIQVAPHALNDDSPEPLSKSLLYQECRRARDSKCDINLFMSQDQIPRTKDELLKRTEIIEQESNMRVLKARAIRKRGGAEIKLFNATIEQWFNDIQETDVNFIEALKTKVIEYAKNNIGIYSESTAPAPSELQHKWNQDLRTIYESIQNDINLSAINAAANTIDSEINRLEKNSRESNLGLVERQNKPSASDKAPTDFKTPAWEVSFKISEVEEKLTEIDEAIWSAILSKGEAYEQFFKTEKNEAFAKKNHQLMYSKHNLSDNIEYVLTNEAFMEDHSTNMDQFVINLIKEFKKKIGTEDRTSSEFGSNSKMHKIRWDNFMGKVKAHFQNIKNKIPLQKDFPEVKFETKGNKSYAYYRAIQRGAITQEERDAS